MCICAVIKNLPLLVLSNKKYSTADSTIWICLNQIWYHLFKISFCVSRNISRNSHADCCLTSIGREPSDIFFVVLNMARTGFIGVVELDGEEYFIVDELVGFESFAVRVYFADIFI